MVLALRLAFDFCGNSSSPYSRHLPLSLFFLLISVSHSASLWLLTSSLRNYCPSSYRKSVYRMFFSSIIVIILRRSVIESHSYLLYKIWLVFWQKFYAFSLNYAYRSMLNGWGQKRYTHHIATAIYKYCLWSSYEWSRWTNPYLSSYLIIHHSVGFLCYFCVKAFIFHVNICVCKITSRKKEQQSVLTPPLCIAIDVSLIVYS